jgi:hypothetical protein
MATPYERAINKCWSYVTPAPPPRRAEEADAMTGG